MSLPTGAFGLSLVAGALSSLSPCVLPLLPIVLGAAAATHRFGAVALAVGLSLSFVAVGLFVATVGFAIGLDGDAFRLGGAILLGTFAVVLLSPALQARLGALGSNLGSDRLASFSPTGLRGQFILGLLLGAVWSPCVGPTLGAAAALAAQRQNLGDVALTMALFGIGAAVPLLAVGTASRELLARWRGRLLAAGILGKQALGAIMLVIAASIVTGTDRNLEAALVALSPAWLADLTARF